MDTVTLSRAEYTALVEAKEMLEDITAYDKAIAEHSDGLPHSLMARLIEGENALVVFREWRGFSQSGLGRKSAVNRVQIADIEAGRKTGSVATLKKLADALGVSMDELV
ncbi:MAG: helix-turn-helix transcriptional regulator [Rhizobiaceae bacterium]